MSASQNPVVHPDENVLAAFAEQALAGAEREAVLSHVSGCARCRDIVFLAQGSAAQPEAAREISLRPARRRWLRWQTATAGAWVLALAVGAVLLWHRREVPLPRNEQALVRPVAPPVMNRVEKDSQQQQASSPAAPATTARQEVNGPVSTEIKAPEMHKKALADRDRSMTLAVPEPEARAQSYIAPPAGAPEQQRAIAVGGLRSMPMAGKQAAPQESNQAALQKSPATAQLAAPPGLIAASNELTKPQAVSVPNQFSEVTVSSATELSLAPSLPQFSIRKGKLERLDAGGGYKILALPGGVQARSVAGYSNVIVLLTRQRVLYRSVDSGEHWTSVPAQWKGKPTALRLRTEAALSLAQKAGAKRTYDAIESDQKQREAATAEVTGSEGVNGEQKLNLPRAKTISPHAPDTVFELTNSAGNRWLSRDGGQTWQPE